MRKLHVKDVVPGMVVGDDVYNYGNQLIIKKGTTLSEKIISRLQFYSIYEVPIMEAIKEGPTKIKHSTYVKNTESFHRFHDAMNDSVNQFKTELNRLTNPKAEVNYKYLLSFIHSIVKETRNGQHTFDMLHCSRDEEDLTYTHSINVAIICNIIGHWAHMKKEDIDILTLSGLLHDIGKLTIPTDILYKPEKLNTDEYRIIKQHAMNGYQLLKKKNIDSRIKYAALMHHERFDCSGYPNGITGSQIDDFAKIVAIADVYEAMTARRCYRNAICPFEVIDLFQEEGYQKYDTKYLGIFLQGIAYSYLHNQVLLSNGKSGEIVYIDKVYLTRPIVKVSNEFIDLRQEQNIDVHIEKIL